MKADNIIGKKCLILKYPIGCPHHFNLISEIGIVDALDGDAGDISVSAHNNSGNTGSWWYEKKDIIVLDKYDNSI